MDSNTQIQQDISSKAWVLPFGNNIHMAISEFEIVHILAGRQRYAHVPRSPLWCRHVFIWCDQLITLFDLKACITPEHTDGSIPAFSSSDIVCIVSYETPQKKIQYGGFLLSSLPFTRVVTDDQMCDYPKDNIDWEKFTLSCFNDPDLGPTPILDVARIFCSSINKPDR